MRRWAAFTAVVAAFCIGDVIQAQGRSSPGSTVLKVHVKAVSKKFIDNAPTGEVGAGDELLLSEIATRRDVRLGRSVVVATIVDNRGDSEETFTLSLPRGDIDYAGFGHKPGVTERFAVTGGTGVYSSARGFVVAKPTDTASLEHDLTFHLQ